MDSRISQLTIINIYQIRQTTEYVITADGNVEILQINKEEDQTIVIEYQGAP